MDAIKRELDELPVVIETDIDDKTISKMILDSPDGTVFVMDENSVFKGIITEGDYIRYIEDENNSLKVNTNCKFVYDNQDTMKEIAFIHMEYKNIRTIPVLDRDKRIVCAYSFELDYTKSYYWILNRLYKLKLDDMAGIYEYLIEKNYTSIAILGVNELAMVIGNELAKHNDIKVIGIYDSIKNEKNFKLNKLEFDIEIYWLDSIDEILEDNNIDMFIVVDLSIRNWIEFKNKYINLNIEYINELVIKIFNFSLPKYIRKCVEKAKSKLNKYGIYTLCVSVPSLDSIKNLRDYTMFNIEKILKEGRTEDNIKYVYNDFDEEYVSQFVKCIFNRGIFIRKNNIICYSDYNSKYINCINGKRYVMNQPQIYNNTIYILGSCIADSWFTEDKYTVGSFLQNMLLNLKPNFVFRVVSIGGFIGTYWRYVLDWLNYLELKKGDIIVFLDEDSNILLSDLNLTKPFNELYQQEDFFLDCPAHCNHKGYKIIAEEIFKYLNENYFNKKETEVCCEREKICLDMDNVEKDKPNRKVFENNRELIKYLEYINKQKVRGGGIEKIGSIVMNCNPFTLGHRYLIETAVKEVDWLYIFVVEEDKSMFSFEDRFELVKRNTEDLKNVTVIPSGNFIISTATFPGYFTKDTPTSVKIDTSTDVEVFGQHIAPALNINIRFVGDEPFDVVTNQYNRSMKEILPKYNVEVKIIERKEIDGEIISASKVRELLKEGKIEDTKKFLTETTFEYIDKLYRDGVQFI